MERRRSVVRWYVLMFAVLPVVAALDVTAALLWGHPRLPMLLGGLLADGVAFGVLVRVRRSLG